MPLHRPLLILATVALGAACTPSTRAERAPVTADSSSATKTATEEPAPVADDPVAPPIPTTSPRDLDPPPAVTDVAPRAIGRPVALPEASGPYRVRVVDAARHDLPRYAKAGRTYVLGTVGSRYAIVITNPTAQRVEAVVSVDGLDAMDGHPANYAEKRGYIVPAYGDVSIDGFRTSFEEVATFRFSSVASSYAGRLGEARDVGVIGVAFFPEAAPLYVPPPPVPVAPLARSAPRASYSHPMPASRPAQSDNAGPLASRSAAPNAPSGGGAALDKDVSERRGLGTEFGEARESRIGSTSFDRANRTIPSQVVAVRYNDRAGLLALGIRLQPAYPTADLTLRETAEPFRSNGFAQPPP